MINTASIGALLVCATIAANGHAAPAKSCAPLAGWSEIAQASAGKYLIFGETHGTREGPQAVEEFICQISNKSVLLGVELDSFMNAELQKAWASHEGFPASVRVATRGTFGTRLDGVASQSMFDMIVRVHDLKDAGADIHIVAFNGPRDDDQSKRFANLPGQEPHEAAQAENIRTAASARSYDHVVILVGSLHAQKSPVQLGDTRLPPMAMKLASPEDIVSLKMGFTGGSVWNCILKPGAARSAQSPTMQDVDCSIHQQQRGDGLPRDQPSMGLSQQEKGFDGYYFLGDISASPPPPP